MKYLSFPYQIKMADEKQCTAEEATAKSSTDNEIHEDFDYSKVTDEINDIVDYLEQLSEEAIKMRVECAIVNIELVSEIDNIEFERKISEAEKLYGDYMKQQQSNNETSSH